jgi:nucleotide-binding universal stress UspA family protein
MDGARVRNGTIVVGIDASEGASEALRWAADVARELGAEILASTRPDRLRTSRVTPCWVARPSGRPDRPRGTSG